MYGYRCSKNPYAILILYIQGAVSLTSLNILKAKGNLDLAYLEEGLGNDERIPRSLTAIFSYVRKYGKRKCREYVETLGGEISSEHYKQTVEENKVLTLAIENHKKDKEMLQLQIQKIGRVFDEA